MRSPVTAAAALLAAAVLTLTACNSTDSTDAAPAATTARPAPAAPAQPPTAKHVAQALADAISHATPATVYTAATDPNDLLGRPGGYTSKADFVDDRAKPDLDDAVQNGGSIEVYDTPADARKRADYIAGILDGTPAFGTEYHYRRGGVLLRVSGELTPAQAAEYETALKRIA